MSACPTRSCRRSAIRLPRTSASRSRCRTWIPRPRSTASSRSRNSVDIADLEGWQAKLAVPARHPAGYRVKKIKEFDNILPIFTKGELEGDKVSTPGYLALRGDVHPEARTRPSCMFGVTDWMTFMPQVYNADFIGYRPDLVDHPVTAVEGVCSTRNTRATPPSSTCPIGIMDAALCARVRRHGQVRQQGQHDAEGDRRHDQRAHRASRRAATSAPPGPRSTSRSTDGRGRSDHPVHVVAGGAAVR